MNSASVKTIARDFCPPVIWRMARAIKRGRMGSTTSFFEGPFALWADAVAHSDGWSSEQITRKQVAAARKVRDGEALVEQDGLVREHIPYSPTLLAFLMLVLERFRAIDIIDFGGGLGTNYHQYRKLTNCLSAPIDWLIVERPDLVKIGVDSFATTELKFTSDLNEALNRGKRALAFTSSFQYLDAPFERIDAAQLTQVEIIAFDKVFMGNTENDEVFVQHPDHRYYDATYPAWRFSRAAFLDRMQHRSFTLVEDFPQPGQEFELAGMLFVRK